MYARQIFLLDYLVKCPTRSKYSPLIMYLLRDGQPQRYSQLKRQIVGVSQKMLTQTLRQLEDQGFVLRTVYPTVPPMVEYQLTPHSTSLLESFLAVLDNEMFLLANFVNCRNHSKWSPLIMYLLRDGQPQRFSQLKRQITGISQKMLTQTLRQHEEQGVVSRTVYPTVPPMVEYQLTPHGTSLIEPFLPMLENGDEDN
jgi:DNA-binding HxlR family transcriptional regulator